MFFLLLARAKAHSEPLILRKRVEQAWRMRWQHFWCAVQLGRFLRFLGLRVGGGGDGHVHWVHEVVNDLRLEVWADPRLRALLCVSLVTDCVLHVQCVLSAILDVHVLHSSRILSFLSLASEPLCNTRHCVSLQSIQL